MIEPSRKISSVIAPMIANPLDDTLRQGGIEMIAPHRSNRKKQPTQDGRRLRRFLRRWLVRTLLAWIQWQRRILVRWEALSRELPRLRPARLPRCLFRRF